MKKPSTVLELQPEALKECLNVAKLITHRDGTSLEYNIDRVVETTEKCMQLYSEGKLTQVEETWCYDLQVGIGRFATIALR